MRERQIIGIVGRKGSGKTTLANLLRDNYGFRLAAFGDPLKRAAAAIYRLRYDQLYGTQEQKEAVDERWGLSPRRILQRLGTDVGRAVHPDTWVRALFDGDIAQWEHEAREACVIPEHPGGLDEQRARSSRWEWVCDGGRHAKEWVRGFRWCIHDVRFPNEFDAVRERGGLLVGLVRPAMARSDTHVSETGVDALIERCDVCVNNEEGKPELLALFALEIAEQVAKLAEENSK